MNNNPTTIPDDPRLTAYVFDELNVEERAEFEQRLHDSPELRTAVEELRGTADLLAAAFAAEPAAGLDESQRAHVLRECAGAAAPAQPAPRRRFGRRSLIALIACPAALAAGVLLLVVPGIVPRSDDGTEDRETFAMQGDSTEPLELAALPAPDEERFGSRVDGDSPASKLRNNAWKRRSDHSVVGGPTAREGGRLGAPAEGLLAGGTGGMPASPGGQFGRDRNGPGGGGGFAGEVSESGGRRLGYVEQDKADASREKRTSGSALSSPSRDVAGRRVRPHGSQKSAGAAYRNHGNPSGYPGIQASSGEKADHPHSNPAPAINRSLKELEKQARQGPAAILSDGGNPSEGNQRLAESNELRLARQKRSRRPETQLKDSKSPGSESYATIVENDFLSPITDPLSTFSIDVDTASYSNVRRFLNHGRRPPADAVRIEELVNYFAYDYPQPAGEHPFSVNLEAGPCPWNPQHRLVRIGLKGREIPRSERPPSNLVFLIDVSGSMRPQNKLPLIKEGLELLVDEMTEDDYVAIVTYSGSARLVLESTSGQNKDAILSAIGALSAGGSTNGEAGIKLAYDQAVKNRVENGANRVILCTDGDFNVGVSDDEQLVRMISQYAKDSGVFLSIFGFGMGNLKDAKLEKLADKGNGHYGYIDDIKEAEKALVEEMTGTLYTIAKDVKVQIEFNPAKVGAWRLIGYENRVLAARDFHDDKKDAGEIGAGHAVTALYEIVPPELMAKREAGVDKLRYQRRRLEADDDGRVKDEMLWLKLRYKQPDGEQSALLQFPLTDGGRSRKSPSRDFEWAASVAAFGMLLRDSKYKGKASWELVSELAAAGIEGTRDAQRRAEFLKLIEQAKALDARRPKPAAPGP